MGVWVSNLLIVREKKLVWSSYVWELMRRWDYVMVTSSCVAAWRTWYFQVNKIAILFNRVFFSKLYFYFLFVKKWGKDVGICKEAVSRFEPITYASLLLFRSLNMIFRWSGCVGNAQTSCSYLPQITCVYLAQMGQCTPNLKKE